jgi:hypothetical protein
MKKDGFKLGLKEMLALFRHEGGKDFVSQWEDGAGRGEHVSAPGDNIALIAMSGKSGRSVMSSRAASVEQDDDAEDVVVRRRGGGQRSKGDGGVYGRRW